MEHIVKSDQEFFTVSVDKVGGMTYITGTELGKQFLLGNLCRIAGINIFAAFLNFCREKTKEKKKLSYTIKAVVQKSKKAQKILYPLESSSGKETVEKKLVKIIPGNSKEILLISSKPKTKATEDDKSYSQNLPSKPQKTLHPNTHQRMDSSGKCIDTPAKSKEAAKSSFQKESEFNQPQKKGTRKESVETCSEGGQNKMVSLLHTETLEKLSLEGSDVEFNRSNQQDKDIQCDGNFKVETTEGDLNVNNSLVKTFSSQNELPLCMNSVLQDGENTKSTEEISPVVKQESEWDSENLGGSSLCVETQTQMSKGDDGLDKDIKMETETSTQDCKWQDQTTDKVSSSADKTPAVLDKEFNSDLVIKKEPVWDDLEGENNTLNLANAEDLMDTSKTVNHDKGDNNDETLGDSVEDSAERAEGGNAEKKKEMGLFTCNVGDNMYCVPVHVPSRNSHGNTKERTRVSYALLKINQAREEEELRRQKERAQETETKNKNTTEKIKPAFVYRYMYKHPKTGKFCSLGQLKRFENLQKNIQMVREKKIQENETERDSDDDLDDGDLPVDLGYTVSKMEWKCHCGKTFKSQPEFSEHDKEYHNTRLRLCQYCGEFIERRKYKTHAQRHEPKVRRYQCSLCDNKYFTSLSLKKHMESFHAGKRYPCNECGKKFSSKSSYQRHQLTHKNILNYLCTFCGKKFVSNYAMKSHMRIHTGERPFTCEYCGLQFNHNVSRKTHIKKTHPECKVHDDANDS